MMLNELRFVSLRRTKLHTLDSEIRRAKRDKGTTIHALWSFDAHWRKIDYLA
jgi:hypothetical protein